MTTLKGIFPNPKPPRKKNFLYENVKSLRKMEKDNAKETDKDDADKLGAKTGPRQSNKYQHVAPRVYSSGRGSSAISTNSSVKNNINCSRISLSGKLSAPSLVKTADKKSCISLNSHPHFNSADKRDNKLKTKERYKSQCNLNTSLLNLDINCETDSAEKKKSRSLGIQTLDTNDLDSLYSEGIIRYPSSRSREEKSCKEVDQVDLNLELDRNSSPTRCLGGKQDLTESSPGKDKDYVKMNKEKITVAARLAAQLNNGVVPPNYRKGVVPKYILERKEEQQQKIEQAKLDAANSDCPPGHIPLPDNERKETLRLLKKNYQELVNELNKMPIRSDTLRCQMKKMEIEKQLTKLEEGIKIFSRPKVFVKTDA
ncbi:uncharacterized protein LOC103570920 isoform X1 [Microplitis demolitor]|uniref:uncharacterized protein LOC103570920 isoform X1 n=2 Tax=Microplitis demolitor TaxID=69319 RepID=UPI0004CDD87E|nr:uncharacterized protein LOC103570920 isoform X1 [Microplitis demolitor]